MILRIALVLAALVLTPLLPVQCAKPYAPKLLYAPTPRPDRVILTWNGDPAKTQSVTWRTDASVWQSEG